MGQTGPRSVESVQALPKAKELTQGQLQPAAQAVAEQAMPTAKKITDDNLRPAAQAVADQACCLSTCNGGA